jgi:hypothetical protein
MAFLFRTSLLSPYQFRYGFVVSLHQAGQGIFDVLHVEGFLNILVDARLDGTLRQFGVPIGGNQDLDGGVWEDRIRLKNARPSIPGSR